jgi:ABC-type Fe3+ transport system substrate-binding protein
MKKDSKESVSLIEQTLKPSTPGTVLEKTNNANPVVQPINGYNYSISASKNGFELAGNQIKGRVKKHKYITPFIISVWPKVFQPIFQKLFLKTYPQYAGSEKGSIIQMGSLHYDNIFYKHIESLTSVDQLPDILVTSDFNNLYHRNFMQKFLNTQNFETLHFPLHPIFSDAQFADPSRLFGMLGSDALVMVVNKSKFLDLQTPREWYELLNPSLLNRIVLCGDRDFFCNTFFYHYIKTYGFEAVKLLAKNTLWHLHPEEMLDSINFSSLSGNDVGASVYVMPYSYARNITNKFDYQIIWPDDGAMLIPIQMLVKKGTLEKHSKVINFLTGEALGRGLEQHGFLATNPNTSKQYPGSSINWIGWNFIEDSDLFKIKAKIRKILSSNKQ